MVQEELKDIYEDNVIHSINQPQDQPQGQPQDQPQGQPQCRSITNQKQP